LVVIRKGKVILTFTLVILLLLSMRVVDRERVLITPVVRVKIEVQGHTRAVPAWIEGAIVEASTLTQVVFKRVL
jgi:hypothetical protein